MRVQSIIVVRAAKMTHRIFRDSIAAAPATANQRVSIIDPLGKHMVIVDDSAAVLAISERDASGRQTARLAHRHRRRKRRKWNPRWPLVPGAPVDPDRRIWNDEAWRMLEAGMRRWKNGFDEPGRP
jgi:hypothetical protein